MEYYQAIKGIKQSIGSIWMNLESSILKEVRYEGIHILLFNLHEIKGQAKVI